MENSNRNKRSNKGHHFENRNISPRSPMMTKTTCSKCGKACEVPFKPTGNRPILCNNCFKNDGSQSARNPGEENFKRSHEDRPMYDAICDTCGNRCRIPFQPRNGRPVFCSHCFEKNAGQDLRRPEEKSSEKPQFKEQFAILNSKLDTILQLLKPQTPEKAVEDLKENKIEDLQLPETPIILEKKKRVSKKMPPTPKE